MQNPSPYDSGYHSNFSTASGPGQPPSSRGNSDIDDQVEHYIRDQRVATIANILPYHASQDTTNQPTPHPRHLNPYQFDIPRAIAEHYLAIANAPDTDHPPPLIPDSDTEDEADIDDTHSVPTLIRLDADSQPNVAHAIDLPIAQPPAPPLFDDERYNLRRNYTFWISHPPCRAVYGSTMVFDIRTATNDSDSTPVYHENSDDNHPGYWPERRASTPPLHNSPIAATISDAQLADRVQPQLPWHEFRHRIPDLTDKPDALCAPPPHQPLIPSPPVLVGPSAPHTRSARR